MSVIESLVLLSKGGTGVFSESDTLKYKKQRNKVNNMKKKAKENFESNLDNILLVI
jgi:hypothetical protein